MRRPLMGILCATALLLASAGSALAVNDRSGCVGQFSTFFAHGGLELHRSVVAQDFAHNARPAGANIYSQVAKTHGDLDSCFEQNQ